MNFEEVAKGMSDSVYQQLKSAVETGRWPDGKKLTEAQRRLSLEAILRYEIEHLPPEQRTGYMPTKAGACDAVSHKSDYDVPLHWRD